jgi:hypothetical protein
MLLSVDRLLKQGLSGAFGFNLPGEDARRLRNEPFRPNCGEEGGLVGGVEAVAASVSIERPDVVGDGGTGVEASMC